MSRHFKLSASALMVAAFVVPTAYAQVAGGGATLPARAYSGTSAAFDAAGPRFSVPAAGSLFAAALPGVAQGYCQTGSTAGRNVITSASGNNDDSRPCPATFASSFVNGVNGYSDSAGSFTAPVDTNYSASDTPLAPLDYQNYVLNEGAAHTQVTQFPSVIGNIAVIVRNDSLSASTKVYLTENELCAIWNGTITNWNQLTRNNGVPYAALPITLAYRSDGSGTSFAFSNHLNWVCGDGTLDEVLSPGASNLPLATNFSVQSSFAAAFPSGIPAGAVSGSGNPGVVSAVEAVNGRIGYVEAANFIANPPPAPPVVLKAAYISASERNAELNATDGVNTPRVTSTYKAGTLNALSSKFPVTFVDRDGSTQDGVYTDRALQANDATLRRPVGTPIALTAGEVPNANCAFFVHPGAYATAGYKPPSGGFVAPDIGYKSYPITTPTYLLGNYSGNTNAANLEALLGSPYNTALRPAAGGSVTSVGKNTGYAFTSGVKGKALNGSLITLNQTRINACTN